MVETTMRDILTGYWYIAFSPLLIGAMVETNKTSKSLTATAIAFSPLLIGAMVETSSAERWNTL